ncbi:MerR family transcriptional regulator [Nonomuraea polychroma]|uniref:MerR family transcriptional regulator n=1 Tax=Nonomuraea polychroma TaxID=46176 RepID=UPI003D9505F8
MNARRWKIGQLAAATGVTVRTLRHFDQIGLLCPAERSAAGHRVYTGDDVRRLYRILALRELRLPLAEIARSLDGADLRETIAGQLEQVERRLRSTAAGAHRPGRGGGRPRRARHGPGGSRGTGPRAPVDRGRVRPGRRRQQRHVRHLRQNRRPRA